jgi:hypothetical protein
MLSNYGPFKPFILPLLYPFPFFSQHLFVEEEEEKQNVPLNPA